MTIARRHPKSSLTPNEITAANTSGITICVTPDYLAVGDEEGYVHFISQVDGGIEGRIMLRPRPLHINYPHQPEATNWRLSRGRDFGIRSNMLDTDEGLLVYTNAGDLALIELR